MPDIWYLCVIVVLKFIMCNLNTHPYSSQSTGCLFKVYSQRVYSSVWGQECRYMVHISNRCCHMTFSSPSK